MLCPLRKAATNHLRSLVYVDHGRTKVNVHERNRVLVLLPTPSLNAEDPNPKEEEKGKNKKKNVKKGNKNKQGHVPGPLHLARKAGTVAEAGVVVAPLPLLLLLKKPHLGNET